MYDLGAMIDICGPEQTFETHMAQTDLIRRLHTGTIKLPDELYTLLLAQNEVLRMRFNQYICSRGGAEKVI